MFSSLTWVPREAAQAVPRSTEFTEEELAAMRAAAEETADDEVGLYIKK
jgi:hypothetical protein